MCSEVRLSPTVVAHVSSACEALMIYGYALETPFWTGSPKVMTRSHALFPNRFHVHLKVVLD